MTGVLTWVGIVVATWTLLRLHRWLERRRMDRIREDFYGVQFPDDHGRRGL